MRINTKNFYDRKLDFTPTHFTKTIKKIADYEAEKLNRWIHENCVGRYSIVKTVIWNKDKWSPVTEIGFEEPSDMTLFALSGK